MIVSNAVHTDSQLSPERFAKAAYTECVHCGCDALQIFQFISGRGRFIAKTKPLQYLTSDNLDERIGRENAKQKSKSRVKAAPAL
jgi:hypothetical protein